MFRFRIDNGEQKTESHVTLAPKNNRWRVGWSLPLIRLVSEQQLLLIFRDVANAER